MDLLFLGVSSFAGVFLLVSLPPSALPRRLVISASLLLPGARGERVLSYPRFLFKSPERRSLHDRQPDSLALSPYAAGISKRRDAALLPPTTAPPPLPACMWWWRLRSRLSPPRRCGRERRASLSKAAQHLGNNFISYPPLPYSSLYFRTCFHSAALFLSATFVTSMFFIFAACARCLLQVLCMCDSSVLRLQDRFFYTFIGETFHGEHEININVL